MICIYYYELFTYSVPPIPLFFYYSASRSGRGVVSLSL